MTTLFDGEGCWVEPLLDVAQVLHLRFRSFALPRRRFGHGSTWPSKMPVYGIPAVLLAKMNGSWRCRLRRHRVEVRLNLRQRRHRLPRSPPALNQ